ncbi:MAG: ACT domain-containing protein [Bacteroidetes bacterium]|nr:ACT domain-containing protein [Bacteroidota bacterium]
MPGETNLSILLKSMKPELNPGEYVFCTINDIANINSQHIISFFREKEGFTVVVEKNIADQLKLSYSFVAKWITLTVHSSLDAVGLTATFANALANENISCNVIAAYYHDHIFLPVAQADQAMKILKKLAGA